VSATIAIDFLPDLTLSVELYEEFGTTLIETVTMTETGAGTREGYYTGTASIATGKKVAIIKSGTDKLASGDVILKEGGSSRIGVLPNPAYSPIT
jgi:hypothetical protein